MVPIKETIFDIIPSTNVRSTQGDRWLFAVSDEYLEEYDNKKALDGGKKGGNGRRKRQLEKYNAYKEEVRWIAQKIGFRMPDGYFAIWFYVPMPKSWRKNKLQEKIYTEHTSTPDWDNFAKAFQDGIMPRKSKTSGEKGRDDRSIHSVAVFKIWVPAEEACIKVIEYSKNDYLNEFRHGHPLKIEPKLHDSPGGYGGC
jgi:Holliday junction resolvase RusA-like endonuclease